MQVVGLIATMLLFGRGSAGDPAPLSAPDSRDCHALVRDVWTHVDRNLEGFFTPPYSDSSWIYGYFDYAYGRGPLITVGSRTLLPGFRGYGLFLSPGYGTGLRPTSAIDLEHFNGGPWYHKFPALMPVPVGVNIDPGTPGRRL
jgi:hypothetical protein